MKFDPTKVNVEVLAGHLVGIGVELAKGTDTPLDDIVLAHVKTVVHEWFSNTVTIQASAGFASAGVADSNDNARARLKAKGVPPWLIELLLKIGGELLERWLKK